MPKKIILSLLCGLTTLALANNAHQHHGATTAHANLAPFTQAYLAGMNATHGEMQAGIKSADPDEAFAKGMIPHHAGAIAMAKTELKYGKDGVMHQLAKDVIAAQEKEIKFMQDWLQSRPKTEKEGNASEEKAFHQQYAHSMNEMHAEMANAVLANNPDVAFAKGMIPHHQGAVAMAKIELQYGKNETMRQLAKDVIAAQEPEIKAMQQWLQQHKGKKQ